MFKIICKLAKAREASYFLGATPRLCSFLPIRNFLKILKIPDRRSGLPGVVVFVIYFVLKSCNFLRNWRISTNGRFAGFVVSFSGF